MGNKANIHVSCADSVFWPFGPFMPFSNLVVFESPGPSVLSLGPLVPWSSGLWSLGPLVLWSSGALVLRSLGPSVFWWLCCELRCCFPSMFACLTPFWQGENFVLAHHNPMAGKITPAWAQFVMLKEKQAFASHTPPWLEAFFSLTTLLCDWWPTTDGRCFFLAFWARTRGWDGVGAVGGVSRVSNKIHFESHAAFLSC